MTQASSSGRVVNLVAVSQGQVYYANPGDSTWTLATNSTGTTPPLNFTGIVRSSANIQKLWFADGAHYCYFDPNTASVLRWSPTAGVLPVDDLGNAPRLICTWRGRTVLSGLINDPQNWFMSAVTDPTNFDYAPEEISPTQAIAGNNSPLGFVGDVITTMIPYTDDVLIMGGDHTIYIFNGDPMAGGQIDLVSSSIGMAWGQPWAMDPYGNIYFVSNRMGIYTMVPGSPPQRISQQIEQYIQNVDSGFTTIRAMWNDRFQGLHFFFTPTVQPGPTTHLFWEYRSGAWWVDKFSNDDHNPLCCCVFDGNLPGDRAALIGSWDGYVRSFSSPVANDDGYPIESMVVLGPLSTQDLDEILLKDLQAVLGESSNPVRYDVYVGATAEIALSTNPVASGYWTSGRNTTALVRRSGHAVYVKLSSKNPWAMEQIRARLTTSGKVRRRGR